VGLSPYRKIVMVDESLYFFNKDVDKKVYEIEYNVEYETKWQVLAKDENEAFNIWLAEHKIDLSTEDGKDTVCSYSKDYTQIGKCTRIATIKLDTESDEVYADET
jgi:hypothetical protein